MRRLTPKQEAFAQAVIAGKNQGEAFVSAYGSKCKKAVSQVRGCELAKQTNIAARIQQLRDRAASPAILTRQRKLERLAAAVEEQVADGKQLTADQIRALEVDNRMQGHNEAEQLKVSGMGSLLQQIRREARKP